MAVVAVDANLGFSRPDEVIDDVDDRGLKRAITRPIDEPFSRQFEYRRCQVRDWSAPGQPPLNFRTMGFESISLARSDSLQNLLAQIRQAGEITVPQARQLRRLLNGRVFPLSRGRCLKMLHVAPEGLIMRKGGPNGLKVDPDTEMGEMNGHDVALAIHGDQDVRGTPLKQMMRGFAPWMFRHQTPDGSNRISPLVLVNLWIPLQQVTRPLTLMDRRTLNAREHQLRYALPTDTFLDRSEDMRENDIWSFLHDEAQQWYFHSHMAHDQAYIFDTLGEPHGSFILPGEDVAERYYLQLQMLRKQLKSGGDIERPLAETVNLPADTTEPLRQAIESMARLIATVPVDKVGKPVVDVWLARATEAMDAVVRKSLEMRVVALLLPNFWPFNRSAGN
ncbi:MAG: hypothetical protein KDI33_17085 [Halioglobus sp.]|nr:hypothetical protein [Halioglobus sp.]